MIKMQEGKLILLATVLFISLLMGQTNFVDKFVNTYSIIAVDSTTGDIGAAVQSHWFSVGSNVIWAEAGIGAVATQSLINPEFGPKGLQLMKSGKSVSEAIDILIKGDEGRDYRQVALIDAQGNSSVFTGSKCIPEAGHIHGKYFSVQANLMLRNTVWQAMENAFKKTEAPLAERLVVALEAAEAEGGDLRGKQSAALLVVRGKSTGQVWKDRSIDLRVEDHPNPLKELKRLLKIHRAYQHMNAGDLAIEKGDEQTALREYRMAENMLPERLEVKYWHAVSLVNIGQIEQALPMFQEIFRKDENWKVLTPRLIKPGILIVEHNELEKILELK